MVKENVPSQTTTSIQILVVKILLILIILLQLPELVISRSRNHRRRMKISRVHNNLRIDCSNENKCGSILEENEMCVSKCMSQNCFQEIYAEKLLERGDIDEDREIRFEKCVKEEWRKRK